MHCNQKSTNFTERHLDFNGTETMLWRVVVFAAVMGTSPTAFASTELHGSGAWFWNALGLGEEAGDVRNDPSATTFPTPYSTDSLAAEDAADDTWAFAVDKSLLGSGGPRARASESRERFKWVFMLITFSGLTALFAGRRSGGRGLISA